MTHTPEPWTCEPLKWDDAWGHVGCIVAVTSAGYSGRRSVEASFRIGRALDNQVQVDERANAVRIVACVNACAGMADPAAEIERLRDQADRLLEACKAMVGVCEGFPDIAAEPSVASCMNMARKAIGSLAALADAALNPPPKEPKP